jgi:hypothetical protein
MMINNRFLVPVDDCISSETIRRNTVVTWRVTVKYGHDGRISPYLVVNDHGWLTWVSTNVSFSYSTHRYIVSMSGHSVTREWRWWADTHIWLIIQTEKGEGDLPRGDAPWSSQLWLVLISEVTSSCRSLIYIIIQTVQLMEKCHSQPRWQKNAGKSHLLICLFWICNRYYTGFLHLLTYCLADAVCQWRWDFRARSSSSWRMTVFSKGRKLPFVDKTSNCVSTIVLRVHVSGVSRIFQPLGKPPANAFQSLVIDGQTSLSLG